MKNPSPTPPPGPSPEHFPAPWASGWGEDPHGLWQSLTYRGVRQAFRWLPPGRFLMGSPEDEHDRINDELQHEVMLT
ncbi:MAG TPA: formylglycine-generating enzyme family protein, partial [Candidatus Competibacter sp.]|nr:formylglycine-generating enzyme family protein [Candidatus Competibacter sp.]